MDSASKGEGVVSAARPTDENASQSEVNVLVSMRKVAPAPEGNNDDGVAGGPQTTARTHSSSADWMAGASPTEVRALYERLRHLREFEGRCRGLPLERDAEREAMGYCFLACCGILPLLLTIAGPS